MKNIREAVHDVIEQRVLPWIEQDGISKLLLPEQITPDDCAKPIKWKRSCCNMHHDHELAIGLTGKAIYRIDNKRVIFTPGRMVLLTAGTPHASDQKTVSFTENLDPDLPSSSLWMTIHPFGVRVQVTRMMNDTDAMEVTWPYLLMGWHFSRLIADLLEDIRSSPPNYARIGRCILMEFMERYLGATAEAPDVSARRRSTSLTTGRLTSLTTDRRAERIDLTELGLNRSAGNAPDAALDLVQVAQRFIRSNYHTPISLDDISEAANISENHLGRLFKAATGLTPIQYLIEVRMEAAKQLLLADLKISKIAQLVGIEDYCYFSRLFRRINGVSPLAYRRQMTKTKRPPPPRKSRKVK